MITTVSSVNVHHHTVKIVFLVMRTFKILSLNTFNTIYSMNCSHHAVCYIHKIYFTTGSLYFLKLYLQMTLQLFAFICVTYFT